MDLALVVDRELTARMLLARAKIDVATRRQKPAARERLRELENEARRAILRSVEEARRAGERLKDIARRLGIAPRTLQDWKARLGAIEEKASPALETEAKPSDLPRSPVKAPRLEAIRAGKGMEKVEEEHAKERRKRPGGRRTGLPGRPLSEAPATERHRVIAEIRRRGGRTTVRELVARFKELATREIAEMLRRYRKLCRLGDRLSLKRLKWRRAGRVWAADHAKSPGRKGRRARQIFAVRDLASGRQITWQFVPEETAATTIAILEEHFERHGAPLVLKLDNGPAFASSEMERFLERWGVELLASPVRTPSFNGAIERAVGVLKRETRRSARAAGRSAKDWREEDLEGARGVNNARPALGERKRSREEVWSQREWITPQERERFRESVREEELKELSAPRYPRSAGEMSRLERQTIRRRAVTRALRAHDILQVRSRRISELILRLRGAGNVQG